MERYLTTSPRSLTDPMLYSSILHVALVAALFFYSMNFENNGAVNNESTTIEVSFFESSEPENSEPNSELYSALTLPPSNIPLTTPPVETENNKSLADFFEQEKLEKQKIEEDKALALERERNDKERLEREHFAQEQEKQQQLEQERQERRRYQQQLQADIDAAHSKRAADLKAPTSSGGNRSPTSDTMFSTYLQLSQARSQVVGIPLSTGGCPATIITHEMDFGVSKSGSRNAFSKFTCTAEVGAASENTTVKNSSTAYGNVCNTGSNKNSNDILKTYMTAPFLNRKCNNGCTAQLECKNGTWEVKKFDINDDSWSKLLDKQVRKNPSPEQYF